MSEPIPLSAITRYLPDLVLERLSRQGRSVHEPMDSRFECAVLFADVSGFTALTERLAAKGEDGVEELTSILNAYFGRVIGIVRAQGGDVIKFAGDAMLAFFPRTGEFDLEHVARRSAECALEIQDSLEDFAAPGGVKLGLRVSISSGEIRSLHIGGAFDRWEFVVAGQPLGEAGTANAITPLGKVALSPGAWRATSGAFRGIDIGEGVMQLESVERHLPPPTPAALALDPTLRDTIEAYMPGAVRHRVRAGQSAYLTEFRALSILFVNLPDMNFAVPLAMANETMRAMQEALYKYEGSLNKLSVDDKGVTLVGVLGLPPLAHLDDPARAVGAALLIHERLSEVGWRHSIGVTTGRTFCGSIGNDARCEYTVIGDVVNLSARLMQAAAGGILCDAATREAAKERVHFEQLPAITVKGKSVSIDVARPVGLRERPVESVGDVIGRDEERQRMAAVLEPGGVLVVHGDTGIGKSYLAGDLARGARAQGLTVLVGSGDATEKSTLYRAWRTVFEPLLAGPGEPPRDLGEWAERASSRQHVDPDLLPLLAPVLPVEVPDSETTAALSGEARASRTNELMIALLQRSVATGQALVLLDDAHDLDSASWALVHLAVREVPTLSLAVFSRDNDGVQPLDVQRLVALPRTLEVALGPLSSEETRSLVASRLALESAPPRLGDLVFDRSQGNPLFAVELALALREAGVVVVESGICRLSDEGALDRIELPDSVAGLVTGRIDRLGARQQLVLKTASVIGRRFSADIVEAVHPIVADRTAVKDELHALVPTGLIGPAEDGALQFTHVVTREVAYGLMGGEQKRALHTEVARWYEAHTRDSEGDAALLAHHWRLAGETRRALDHTERAAVSALRAFANHEAVVFFESAVELLGALDPDPERRGRAYCGLAEARYRLGDLEGALASFGRGLELLGAPFPSSMSGFVLATFREFGVQTVHRLLPSLVLGRSSEAERPRLLEVARSYERLAQIRYLNNAKVQTLHSAFRALNLAERAGPSPELARSYANAAVCNGLLLLHGVAQAHTRRASLVAESVRDPSTGAYVDFINSAYWVTVGDWDNCSRALRRAIAIAEELGDWRRWDESVFTLVNARAREGRFDESADLARRLLASAESRGVPQSTVWGLCGLAWSLFPTGFSGDELDRVLGQLAEVLAGPGVPLADRILGHGFASLAAYRRGEIERSARAASACTALIEGTQQVSHYILEAHVALLERTQLCWADAGTDEARAQFERQSGRLLKGLFEFALMYPFAEVRRQLHRGTHLWLSGHQRRARRSWRRAIEKARALSMPFERCLAELELLRHAAHPPGDEQWSALRSELETLGATSLSPRASASTPGND